ncbi:MAG: hypothetical protein E5W59_23275, partial [Mesorhizobium sp.]
APHCPAGHFSPYCDGEKDAFAGDFANHKRCRKLRCGRGQLSSPRLRGEGAGRRMRGGATIPGLTRFSPNVPIRHHVTMERCPLNPPAAGGGRRPSACSRSA